MTIECQILFGKDFVCTGNVLVDDRVSEFNDLFGDVGSKCRVFGRENVSRNRGRRTEVRIYQPLVQVVRVRFVRVRVVADGRNLFGQVDEQL